MWTCPKCGRGFKRTEQSHYCGKAPATVEEYIKLQSPEIRNHLSEMRLAICRAVPDIKERIAWSMPTYEKLGKTISFAACKEHISLYAGIEAIECFKSELDEFTSKKSAIYFPYHKELPLKLIENIVKSSLK